MPSPQSISRPIKATQKSAQTQSIKNTQASKNPAAENSIAGFVPDQLRVASLREAVWNYYRKHARSSMPWRITPSPYFVLLSEVMSQQTQISRVEPYFTAFITRWPDIAALARAELKDVLTQWSGLGYYRRAKYLHECARAVCSQYGGEIPREKKDLLSLPGVGDYTASAVVAFAYNKPVVVLDTNVRRVMIHHFFPQDEDDAHAAVSDALVRVCVEASMDRTKPRAWYWALMDYGANLAFCVQNPNRRSAAYVKQSRFEGSGRQLRAAILRSLMEGTSLSARGIEAFVLDDIRRRRPSGQKKNEHPKKGRQQNQLFADAASSDEAAALSEKRGHIQTILQTLVKEKLIVREKQRYYLG